MSIDSSQISEREREILRLVAMGATNQQIAHQLNISINTVKVHLRNIFGKINVASRTEATVYAIQQGLVSIDVEQTSPIAPVTPTAPNASSAPATVLEPASEPLTTPSEPPAPSTSAVQVNEAPAVDARVPEASTQEPPAQAQPVQAQPVEAQPVQVQSVEAQPAQIQPVQAQTTSAQPIPARQPNLLPIVAIALLIIVGLLVYILLNRPTNTPPPTPSNTPIAQPNNWRQRTQLPSVRYDFGATTYDNKLYVIGGQNAQGSSSAIERYDPNTNTWVSLTDKPTAASHVQAAVVRGIIYVPGGERSDGSVLDTLEAYDPRTQRWEQLPPLPEPRSRYALASEEGRLYLFGGWDGSTYRNEVFIYDPDSKTWRTGAVMPTPRRHAGAAAVEGRIYVIGGENDTGALRVNERYDPNIGEQGQWQSVAPLPTVMAQPAETSIGSNVLIFAASQPTGFQYNTTSDAWEVLSIPEQIPNAVQVTSFNNTSVFLFSNSEDDQPSLVSEYQAINRLFLPNIGAGE
jgi:DNA-binding CsgD family transcriptional regulator